MNNTIERQLWETASGLLAGGGLELCFELMRPMLNVRRRALRLISQITYLLIAFVWIFLSGQLGGRGASPLYLLVCAAGWWLTHSSAASVRRSADRRKLSICREKLTNIPDMRDFADKQQKKCRKNFSKGTMQKRKNHI